MLIIYIYYPRVCMANCCWMTQEPHSVHVLCSTVTYWRSLLFCHSNSGLGALWRSRVCTQFNGLTTEKRTEPLSMYNTNPESLNEVDPQHVLGILRKRSGYSGQTHNSTPGWHRGRVKELRRDSWHSWKVVWNLAKTSQCIIPLEMSKHKST